MKKRTKVLILSHSSEIGGAELSMIDLFDYWEKKEPGIEPLFIIKQPPGRLADELKERKWNYADIQYSSWVMPKLIVQPEDIFRNAKSNTKAISEIEDIVSEFKPDIVMTNTTIAPWAAFAAKLNALPHIWFVREYGDLDHGHSFQLGKEQTFKDIDLLSDMVVTCSRSLGDYVKKFVSPDKVTPLYTPFKLEEMQKKAKAVVDDPFSAKADIKAVMTGVIKPSKGHEAAIKAIAELSKKGIRAELCVIGNAVQPEYMAQLKQLIKKNNLKNNIHFVGKQPNPMAYIAQADVGIMASKMEAFGRVTFEYLYLGKPVIGAASGGTLEMVNDGGNGFLYEPDDVDGLVGALEKYANNRGLLAEHAVQAHENAVSMVEGQYGAQALIEKIERLLQDYDNDYRLPNFTREWLALPAIVGRMKTKNTRIDYVKRVIKLGPRAIYLRGRRKAGLYLRKIRRQDT